MGYEEPGADSLAKGTSCLGSQILLPSWDRPSSGKERQCVCKQLHKQQTIDKMSLIHKEIL